MEEVSLLKDIIKIYSPSEKEKEVSDYLFNFLKKKGFDVEQDKEWNIISKLGSGPPYILLTSHMDTVTGEIPFRSDGNKIYGRGACDAKSPLAALLSAFIRFKNKKFKGTLIFAGVTGEEAPNSRGTLELMRKIKADFIFLGEPGSVDGITIGYKGRLLLKLIFKGKASHSSSEEENPVLKFIDFSNKISKLYKGDNLFESLSYSPTSIYAQSDSNVMPSECRVTIDFRVPPGLSHQEVLKEIKVLLDGEIELVEGVDGVITSKNNILVKTLVKIIRENGFSPKYKKKTGSSDMNLLVRLTDNIVTYGPGDSSLDHTDMEYIDTDEYLKSIDILEGAISEILGIASL
ncbi:MAG: acetyl-lysine deacetylase [Candidatus Methanofastidiosum methylothiophilum]|uniref:Putative [LysW]-lysine/[LysW]-ornithine hydrolase n=1 Tax=Candidatus Methanofastidiosum methylothiophilum TaxID=1705564 RepID=A0A150IY25_9EURY|nr:MAG: acetyl-lysine deacetylase [Candidatus Methanofastidiosum methylthiophilus]KYC47386.1 MAG: acetyl-lysine deacetylase [Candidatus Methanofastidiosum methylthiophilus]KYC49879.1 MAG: acetyl-lysine deacetylase [Candidatus Methanofastidiosum methylthiophilus]